MQEPGTPATLGKLQKSPHRKDEARFIPTTLEELTPEFLTLALRESGALSSGSVGECSAETIGDGVGFAGTVARIHLRYRGADIAAPESLIAKLPSMNPKNRASVEMINGYEREICFFQRLAGRSILPVPRCYYAAMDPDPHYETRPAQLRCMEHLPVAVLRALLPAGRWFAGISKRRYCVLMEDLAPARAGDQVAGCGLEEAEEIVRGLAAFHASYWGDERLADEIWLPSVDALPRGLMALHRNARRRYFHSYGANLPARMHQACAWTDSHFEAMMHHLASPPNTVLHGDYRLDNFVFADDTMCALDFQVVALGRGGLDLGYFVCGSVHLDVDEERIVNAYCDELLRLGVRDYDRAECTRDYNLSKLFQAYMHISGEDLIELGEDRGAELLETMRQRVIQRIPEPPYDALL
ncbi:MAG: phosphotransferase [Deltaproteobacteria bacterium]|nr:phosphotransferase [Deltaproteobacteria bacterium]